MVVDAVAGVIIINIIIKSARRKDGRDSADAVRPTFSGIIFQIRRRNFRSGGGHESRVKRRRRRRRSGDGGGVRRIRGEGGGGQGGISDILHLDETDRMNAGRRGGGFVDVVDADSANVNRMMMMTIRNAGYGGGGGGGVRIVMVVKRRFGRSAVGVAVVVVDTARGISDRGAR